MGEKGSGPATIITARRQAIAVAVGELNWMNECCVMGSTRCSRPVSITFRLHCQPAQALRKTKQTKKTTRNHSPRGTHTPSHVPACTVVMGVAVLRVEQCTPPLSARLTALIHHPSQEHLAMPFCSQELHGAPGCCKPSLTEREKDGAEQQECKC